MDDVLSALQAHGLKRREQIISNFESKNISGKILEKGKISELKKAEEGEGDDHWITVNGRHILISGAGEVKQGGKGMADGKNIKKIGSGKGMKFEEDKDASKQKDYELNNPTQHREDVERGFADQKKQRKHEPDYDKKKKPGKPSKKELRAKEFESTYSKKEAKKYAEGGTPTSKKEERRELPDFTKERSILAMKDKFIKNADSIDQALEDYGDSDGGPKDRSILNKKVADLLDISSRKASLIINKLDKLAEEENPDATSADFADKIFKTATGINAPDVPSARRRVYGKSHPSQKYKNK